MAKRWLIAIPIVAVLLGLCVLITAILVFNLRQADFFQNVHVDLSIRRTTAESDVSKTFDVGAPATFVIDSVCGKVQVVGDQSDQIRVALHKRAYGLTQSKAQEALDQMVVNMTQSGDTVTVTVDDTNNQTCPLAPGPLPALEFTVGVPANTRVEISTSSGNVSLEGTSLPANLTTQFGDVSVGNLSDRLEAKTSNGRITAQDIQAGGKEIVLKTSFGVVSLDHSSAETLSVSSENGSITLTGVDVSGMSQVSSQFGALSWTGGKLGGLQLTSTNGEVDLTNLNLGSGLNASSNFGRISLSNVEAETYSLTTLNGAITVDKATGPVKAKSDFGDISLTNAGKINFDLSSKNGSISYQGELGQGAHHAATEFGNIRFQFPSGSAFDFDLQTSFGVIHSDFAVTIQGAPDEHHWQGEAAGGGPQVTAQTNNGNITLAAQ